MYFIPCARLMPLFVCCLLFHTCTSVSIHDDDRHVLSSGTPAGDAQDQISTLKRELETEDAKDVPKTLNEIHRLSHEEDANPAGSKEKATKIRINRAHEAAEENSMATKENAEKKAEQAEMEANMHARRQVTATREEMKKSRELSSKKIDSVKKEEGKKTARAEAQVDSLKGTLMRFMKHAHDKLFSQKAQDKFKADDQAAAAKRNQEKSRDELKKAELVKEVADTQAAAASQKLKGIMIQVSEGTHDHEKMKALAQDAQSAKTEVVVAQAKAKAAAQVMAQKKQEADKHAVTANAASKHANEEDKKATKAASSSPADNHEY